MDAGIDECYRRPSEFDLTVIGHQANENGAALHRILQQLGFLLRHAEIDIERSEEHTSELQSLMRISYAVFCLKKENSMSIKSNKYTALKLTQHNNIPSKIIYITIK